jgi:hypothetical protein
LIEFLQPSSYPFGTCYRPLGGRGGIG